MRSKIHTTIVHWIKTQVQEAGAKGVVMGISGGIDSAVVAACVKEAVGRNKVLALWLSCHSQKQDMQDAKLVARVLKIPLKALDISGVYDAFLKMLPSAGALARANLKPRLRMLVLYYYANKLNYLVCGTGNKSELTVGYFTKHGDGATDILPIGNLLKRQVRALALELKIPEQVIAKPPTAGLWPGQTDEGEMGLTYNDLDSIIHALESRVKPLAPKAKIEKVKRMMKRSAHKRQGPKICGIK